MKYYNGIEFFPICTNVNRTIIYALWFNTYVERTKVTKQFGLINVNNSLNTIECICTIFLQVLVRIVLQNFCGWIIILLCPHGLAVSHGLFIICSF